MSNEIVKKIKKAAVIPVIEIDSVEDAIPLANALLEGGINIVEITLRSSKAIKCAEKIIKNIESISVGVGTLISADQVTSAIDIGVDFAFSPGCNPKIINLSIKENLLFIPGISTPTEIEIAYDNGCDILKYFHSESNGGLTYLKNIYKPYNHLNLKFIPTGGVNLSNCLNYINTDFVLAIGSGWIAPKELIRSKNWNLITSNARNFLNKIKKIKNQFH
tara:strand:+ start:1583 stop:2239 length:657 start_codon:yes stop_codon:yes gene_type:complete